MRVRPVSKWHTAKPGDVIALAADYPQLLTALRAWKDDCGYSNEATDTYVGLADGATSKIFCSLRNLGPLSLSLLLAAFNLKLAVVVAGPRPVPAKPRAASQDRNPIAPAALAAITTVENQQCAA